MNDSHFEEPQTINVVDLEDETRLVVSGLAAVLLDALHEFFVGHGTRSVLVKQLEHSFNEERLSNYGRNKSFNFKFKMNCFNEQDSLTN